MDGGRRADKQEVKIDSYNACIFCAELKKDLLPRSHERCRKEITDLIKTENKQIMNDNWKK